VLKELKDERHPIVSDLQIKLMGRVDPIVVEAIHKADLTEFLILIPTQPHDEALRQMRSAQILLLCIFEQNKFIVTGKLFEYLACQRPIFCIGSVDGDAAAILKETNAGTTFSFNDKDGVKQHLLDLYKRFKSGELRGINDAQKYSHQQLVKEIAGILNKVVTH
jgi:hypothetical protein